MGVQIPEIFSAVQSNIGDDAMDAVHIGHYVDNCNRIANIIAIETQMWIGRYEATPVNDMFDWTIDRIYTRGQLVIYNSITYVAIDENVNERPDLYANRWAISVLWVEGTTYTAGAYVHLNNTVYNVVNTTTTRPPSADYKVYSYVDLNATTVILPYKIHNEWIAPYKFLSVYRGHSSTGIRETTEYSVQSISNTLGGIDSFRINRTFFDGGKFGTDFVNKAGTISGDIRLHVADTFLMDEKIFIDYISQTPFKITNWNQTPPISVPDFLQQSFIYGLTWLIADMLYNRGNNHYMTVADRNKVYFDRYLRDAVGYTRMLRNNNSTLQMQPINWLPED